MSQSTKTQPQPKTAANRPVQELSAWPLRCAVWRHDNGNGSGVSYSVRLTKTFRRKSGDGESEGAWEDTEFLSQDDLLGASRLLAASWDWIVSDRQRQHERR